MGLARPGLPHMHTGLDSHQQRLRLGDFRHYVGRRKALQGRLKTAWASIGRSVELGERKWGASTAGETNLAEHMLSLHLIGRFEIGRQARSSSSKALASFKSSVSKPSVNQP
jgi:hypothetical protein